jgi:PPOX class probable F420-dependent enzyme
VATDLERAAAIPDHARTFVTRRPRYATLATINSDGSPHQVVTWFLLRGDYIVVNSRHGRRWPANLRRDPRASLAVYEAEDAVTFDCESVEVYDDARAQADIAEMAFRYDAPDVARREIARFQAERRLSFVLRPTRVHIHGDPG